MKFLSFVIALLISSNIFAYERNRGFTPEQRGPVCPSYRELRTTLDSEGHQVLRDVCSGEGRQCLMDFFDVPYECEEDFFANRGDSTKSYIPYPKKWNLKIGDLGDTDKILQELIELQKLIELCESDSMRVSSWLCGILEEKKGGR